MALSRPLNSAQALGDAAEEWASIGSPSMAARYASRASRVAETEQFTEELAQSLSQRRPAPRATSEPHTTLYGRIRRTTAHAVQFQVTVYQPVGAPREAVGHTFWFPRRGVTLFRSREGHTAIDLPLRFLREQLPVDAKPLVADQRMLPREEDCA